MSSRAVRRGPVVALVLGAMVAATTMIGIGAASAVDVAVTTTTDGGAGSLRDAFTQASASATPSTITLQTAQTYTLDSCVAADGDLDYTNSQPLTIVGNGSTIRQTCAGERVIESDGDITLQDVIVTGGAAGAGALGGGIEADTDDVTLLRSSVVDNSGGTGGGVGAIRVVLTDSTIAGNQASSSGGGVWADQTITATNSTVTGNSATIAGGGLAVVNTSISLLHATVAGNTGPTGANIQLQPGSDTLIAFGSVVSLPVGGGANCDLAPGATTTSQGYNSTSDASCGLVGTGDVVTADPGLGSLTANGGPTATRLPAVASPLRDVVPCASAPTPVVADQRGVARPQGTACDVGAVEVEVEVATTTTSTVPGGSGGTAAGPSAGSGVARSAQLRFTG